MALITRYVNTASTAGGDGTTNNTTGATRAYATQQECETNEQADFVTDTNNLVVECSGTTADTAVCVWDGSTANATYDIVVNGDATGGVYSTSHYRMEFTATANFQEILTINDPSVTHNDIQIQATDSGGYSSFVAYQWGANNNLLNNGIIKGVISGAGSQARGLNIAGGVTGNIVQNTVVYDFVNGTESCLGMISGSGSSTVNAYNNTIINCYTGLQTAFTSFTAVNNISQDCNTPYTGTFVAASDYNLSDAASGAPGANSVHSATLTFNNKAGDDFHLVSGDTEAIGAGVGPTTDSNVPTLDIDGDTRSGTTTDIGFDLYVSSGTNVSATTDTLVISEQSANVNAETNLTTIVDTLAITTLVATISTSSAIQATTQALSITEQGATISLDINILTNTQAISITEQAVTLSLDKFITTTLDTLAISSLAASITLPAGGDTNINTTTSSLFITERQASIIGTPYKKGGGLSLTEEEYYRLERKQIEEQRHRLMVIADDDEIITLII